MDKGGSMELATLHDKIEETVKSGKPKMYFNLMGTENFRVWLNVYMPGNGTNGLHYHNTDETFTVIEGKGEIIHRDGRKTTVEKGSVVLIPAKYYYDIKNTGASVLALLGNRAEGFGGPTVYLDPVMNEQMKGRKQFGDI
jgi:mannose-6-phosphate isomerase-like protein (cupin superfamily)